MLLVSSYSDPENPSPPSRHSPCLRNRFCQLLSRMVRQAERTARMAGAGPQDPLVRDKTILSGVAKMVDKSTAGRPDSARTVHVDMIDPCGQADRRRLTLRHARLGWKMLTKVA